MPGPSMCAGVCVWRRRKGREGGGGGERGREREGCHKFVPCHAQSIPFYTHATKLTTATTKKMQKKRYSRVNKYTEDTHTHTHSYAPVII